MSTLAALGNLGWLASNVPAHLRFCAAVRNPRDIQLALLREHLLRNAGTEYGRLHRFDSIKSYQDFQNRVPLVTYDELAPWIERIRRGESNVLTRDRVTHLIPTSGSTSARKLIPFTNALQRQFNRAIAPWICDLFAGRPSLALGSAYWSITPAAHSTQSEGSIVRIGFDDDTSYLGGARKRLVAAVSAAPSEVRLLQDIEMFRYVTLLCLLRRPDLALISVWHPSFLTLLMDALPQHWSSLIADVESGNCSVRVPTKLADAFRARSMSRRAAKLRNGDPSSPQTLWPRLRAISCWGDAHAELFLDEIQKRFPRVDIQPKGLLATEAFVTIPFAGQWPLAIRSHFFEFIDDCGRVRLADELDPGGEYEIIVTTAGGLSRYRLGDRVRVNGSIAGTPSLKFIGRNGNVSDWFGEKLSEAFVADVIREVLDHQQLRAPFAMLAPDNDTAGFRYTFYIQANLKQDFGVELDVLLRRNPHYNHCRSIGQLLAPAVFCIVDRGFEAYAAHELGSGKRLGEIKASALSKATGWSDRFKGHYLMKRSHVAEPSLKMRDEQILEPRVCTSWLLVR